MRKIHLADGHWAFIQRLLPPPTHMGRPGANDRRTTEGALYVLITGGRAAALSPPCAQRGQNEPPASSMSVV